MRFNYNFMGSTKEGWIKRKANGNGTAWNKGKKGVQVAWNKGISIKDHPTMGFQKGHKFNRGENSYLWKGGITPINEKIRQSYEYKFWHKSCFVRDNFTCQKTGQIGGRLVVHHINNFSDFPELRMALENGITLSEKAHIEFHKKYGRKNNTREQIEEFLQIKYTA